MSTVAEYAKKYKDYFNLDPANIRSTENIEINRNQLFKRFAFKKQKRASASMLN